MTGEYISLVFQSKSRNTWRGSIYHWSFKVNPETHDGGVYITGLSKKILKHMTEEYISLVWQSKSWNTWRGSIYLARSVIYTPPSCVSGFTLQDQWYILSCHVFRDLLCKTSDIYSPVMCFGIYFERPVIYTLPSCVSGFTLRDQWYILPRHVFRDLRWRVSIYHWSYKVNPEPHDGRVYITGLTK
jgi:hypothetical protein